MVAEGLLRSRQHPSADGRRRVGSGAFTVNLLHVRPFDFAPLVSCKQTVPGTQSRSFCLLHHGYFGPAITGGNVVHFAVI